MGGEAAVAAAFLEQKLSLNVDLEITSECNLDCAMCIRQSWQGSAGRMSAELFAGVLDQLRAMPSVETINFSGYGEPMSHPAFFDFAADADPGGQRVARTADANPHPGITQDGAGRWEHGDQVDAVHNWLIARDLLIKLKGTA